ncbi:hypothetical protein IWW50_003966 [Coemansia erecta]|nr:hypothetical protein GGF43_003359 [Coemansia sp. RSA 2618]KAJ2823010.1 hypothetical protein IWW50_003966 [Coemansia erecta]
MALGEQLEALGSVLKSQIMSDLNAWEDRRRSEAQTGRSGKKAAKRARPQPLPEIPHGTLVELRQAQHSLLSEPGVVGGQISSWAIGVLTVFVSVADMKGNCKLSDLIGLPGAKAMFQLLVLAVESSFSQAGVEAAETAFIDTVLATSKNPRAVGWILNQYGATHSAHFSRMLHLYAVSQLARGNAAIMGAENTGLATAISDLAASHPEQNARALDGILDMYRQAVLDSSAGESVAADDPRRFVLFYLLHSQSMQLRGSRDAWLGAAIRFEMRTGFSRFLVQRDEACNALPLAESIQVLFGDHGRAKKVSDQALDIGRVLSVFELIGLVIRDSSSSDDAGAKDVATGDKMIKEADRGDTVVKEADTMDTETKNMDTQDVEAKDVKMGDTESDRLCEAFIDACAQTLRRLITREQELVLLGHMPRVVKNMPQPIVNGLHEAVQRGGRTYNNGPISQPTITPDDAGKLCARLFSIIRAVDQTALLGTQLHVLLCDATPILIEILAARADAPAAGKALVRCLVYDWPLRLEAGPDTRAAAALLRALVAVGEANRGLLPQQLYHVIGSRLKGGMSAVQALHMVDMFSIAVDQQALISSGAGSRITGEAASDLCNVLASSWRQLWVRCFSVSLAQGDKLPGAETAWSMRVLLVRTLHRMLQTGPTLRMIDRIPLLEHALREVAKIQHAILHPSFAARSRGDVSGMLGLAHALLAFICCPHSSSRVSADGIERIAMERLVHLILICPSTSLQSAISEVFTIDDGDESSSNMLREPPDDTESAESLERLESLLEGRLLPSNQSAVDPAQGKASLDTAEQLLWQNAIRPMPKYPRSAMCNYDSTDDAWAFARPKPKGSPVSPRQPRSLLVYALLALAHSSSQAMDALGQLLEEYYVDSMPSMPPALLDARLEASRLQLRPVEMELLEDMRQNGDLERVLFKMVGDSAHGARAAQRLVSALLVALVVFWNGALGESTTRRADDLAFTTRLVSLIADAYAAPDSGAPDICPLFPIVTGKELARLLHHYVWRWILHRMPAAEVEAHKTIRHVMRRHIVRAAPLFKTMYPFDK